MAQLKSQTFGVINGKVGNVVYRQVNGKTFASIRPDKYNVTNTEKSVKVKTGFKNLVKFSAYINSIPILKAVWFNKKIQRGKRTYNKIFSHNKRLIKSDNINKLFSIVPKRRNGNILIYNFTIAQNQFNFLLKLADKMDNYNDSKFVSVLVIYNIKKGQFTYQADELITEEVLDQYNVAIKFSDENYNSFNSNEESILFHTLVWLNDSDQIIDWSDSLGLSNNSQ